LAADLLLTAPGHTVNTEELDQNAIDSLFSEPVPESETVRVNFAERRLLTAEQMKALISLSQPFASSMSTQLSSKLNADVKLTMISAERVLCRDQIKSSDPEVMYLSEGIFDLTGTPALLQIDLACVNPLVHLSLGGSVKFPEMTTRELTTIDNEIMESIMQSIWLRLNDLWSPFSMRAKHRRRILPADILQVFPPSEYLLSFTYGISVGSVEGFVILSLSTSVADAFLKSMERTESKRMQSPEIRRGLEDCVGKTLQVGSLQSAPFKMRVLDLTRLEPGDLLLTGVPAGKHLEICIGNGPVWQASAVAKDGRICAQLERLRDVLQ
jgi:flagellar motor switch protein FliM